MANGREWTKEEIEYLEEKWGYVGIERISSKLGRTKTAIRIKAKRLKLGGATVTGEFVTAFQAARLLGIDRHVVADNWITNLGLKATKQNRTGNRLMWYIKLSELLEWLRANQDRWDSRKLELYALGEEPKWLTEKRIRDKNIPERRFYKYTIDEDVIAKSMFYRGFTYAQIGKRINRSRDSVERRLSRIKK